MSVGSIDPLPPDVRETLARLSDSMGQSPVEVLREALDRFARDVEDSQAAERMTPSTDDLRAIVARKPKPLLWHDSEEALH